MIGTYQNYRYDVSPYGIEVYYQDKRFFSIHSSTNKSFISHWNIYLKYPSIPIELLNQINSYLKLVAFE